MDASDLLAALRGIVGEDGVVTEADALVTYGQDWTRAVDPRAQAVCFPRSTEEVSRVLAACSRAGVAVVPSGGRTGLAAGAVAAHGELVLSLERMHAIGEVDATALTVHVEAGAVTQAVHERCAKHGLFWPIDLGSKGSCQVGGNLSTNAGGLRVIRYGGTRGWVLGVVAVKMDGEVLRTGGARIKDNTGYDLRDLLIGSEGTLAVITEATLKLVRLPAVPRVMLFALRDLDAVLGLLGRARKGPFELCAFEFFQDACLVEVERMLNGRSPFAARAPVYALVEVEPRGDDDALAAWIEDALAQEGVQDGVLASSEKQARDLWRLRENITESLARGGLMHKADISVPVATLPAFVHELVEMLRARVAGVALFLFGHIGDGNVHVNLQKPADMSREEFLDRAHDVDHAMGALLAAHGGSVSAEHGIGLLKKELLGYTRSEVELALFRGIKKVFDPQGLLNPGKIFD